MSDPVHYSDYLQLDKILTAQVPESNKNSAPAHDEMLFIITHQTYELWFKELHYELDSIIEIMQRPVLNDNAPELQTVVHRLGRMTTILQVLVHQVDIIETMTPMDFLDFRDMLRPASGFQSWQFKELEAKLGLTFEQRFGKEYYVSQLKTEEVAVIKKAEQQKSLLQLVNNWLERMPYIHEQQNFWDVYRQHYNASLSLEEKDNLVVFDRLFIKRIESDPPLSLSVAACRAALFITLYRGYPVLQLPFQLLNTLLEIDVQLSSWRYRHMNMVQRMIGTRIGTGGSSGKDYLHAAAGKHYIFKEIAQLNSFLIERKRLPVLDSSMEKKLGFVSVN